MTYIALLRGINVGGNNIIKMLDLRTCFEQMGFAAVSTYIQSGNVMFDTKMTAAKKLEKQIEAALKKQFRYAGVVVVISKSELEKIILEAPQGFGANPEEYRYDVLFMKQPTTAKIAAKSIPTREGVDTMHVGAHAIYFSRLIEKASRSHLSKITSLPVYQSITIRNWNTTTKLLSLVQG